MTQVCSLPSSAADVNDKYNGKRLPKGIHIVEADDASDSKVGGMSKSEDPPSPWGYIFIQHMSAGCFEKRLDSLKLDGEFKPNCFVHRSLHYKQKANGRGVQKEMKPSISGLVFLQGETNQLKTFLTRYFPQYNLVNDCCTSKPATIPDNLMRPFMKIMSETPERVTFLRDPFEKFAKDHVKLRVLTGVLKGQEGYIVRILRDRQLVMDLGGYAVAISNVHREDFEIAE